MRRILFFLGALLALLPLSAQQTQDALYIYRNDGVFHGFFYADIEKIEFSKIDTLGVEHYDYVVQEVYALDSIYRIPLSAIDSVSFITPETKYQEGVVTSESTLWNYVIGSNDPLTCFTLSASTPAVIVPKVGAKLANTRATTYLPYGFYGQVTSVSNTAEGIEVVAERVPMEELFKQHIIKVAVESENWSETEMARRSSARRVPQTLIPLDLKPEYKVTLGLGDLSLLYPSDVIFSGTGNVTLSIKPKVSARAFASIGWVTSSVYDMQFRNEMKTDFSFKASGTLMMRKDVKLIPKITVPIGATGFVFTMDCGSTLSYSGKIEVDYHSYNHSVTNATMMANIDPYGWVEETSMADGSVSLTRKELAASEEIAIRSKGTLQAGFFATPAISLMDVVSLTARVEVGDRIALSGELSASASTTIPDGSTENIATSQYDELNHDGSVTIDLYTSGTAIGAVTGTKWKVTKSLYNEPIARAFSGALVPKFSDLGYVAGEGTSFVFSANLSRDVLFKSPVGFALYDSNNKLVKSKWADFSYDGTQKKYSLTFDGLQQDANYTVFPTCKVFGSELLGSPRMLFSTRTDGKLTLSHEVMEFGKNCMGIEFGVIAPSEIASVDIEIDEDGEKPDWLTYEEESLGDLLNTRHYNFWAEENSLTTPRYATVNVTAMLKNGSLLSATARVTQEPKLSPPSLELSSGTVCLPVDGDASTVKINSNTSDVTINRSSSWIQHSYNSKTGKLTIWATENSNTNIRTGKIHVIAANGLGTLMKSITVKQLGKHGTEPIKEDSVLSMKINNFEFICNVYFHGDKMSWWGADYNKNFNDPDHADVFFTASSEFEDNDIVSLYYMGTVKEGATTMTFTATSTRYMKMDEYEIPYYEFGEIYGHVQMAGWYFSNYYGKNVYLTCEFDYMKPSYKSHLTSHDYSKDGGAGYWTGDPVISNLLMTENGEEIAPDKITIGAEIFYGTPKKEEEEGKGD